MAQVRLQDVSKSFGTVRALDSISLEVRDKEFLVFLGPSGCGKTTALRCIAGLERPDRGEIYIDGNPVNDLLPRERDVAVVFQSYALYPHKTVYNNLAFPLQVRGKSRQTIDQKVKEIAQLLRIEHLFERKPRQLSGGEQQRVALGRALVREPKVFLMDEPLSNLDAKLRFHMRGELKRLHKKIGITTVYVTHDQAEAMTMADRVAVLNRGLLMQLGQPEEIYNFPADTFVAGFLGSPPMNLLDATVLLEDGGLQLDFFGFRYRLPRQFEAVKPGLAHEQKIIFGVRPEDVVLSKDRTDENAIGMEVFVLEPLGSELVVDLKLGETLVRAKTSPSFKAALGENIFVAFDPGKIHLFEPNTMRAIA